MNRFGSGFISKSDVKKTPIIGSIATSLQSLFLDRENAKDREVTVNINNNKLSLIKSRKDK